MNLPRRRVPAPFPSARAAAGIRAHPALRVVRPPAPRRIAAALPATARRIRQETRAPQADRNRNADSAPRPLWTCPAMRRADGPVERLSPSAATAAVAASTRRSTPMIRSFSSRATSCISRHIRVVPGAHSSGDRRHATFPRTSRPRFPFPPANLRAPLRPSHATALAPSKTHNARTPKASFKSLYRKRSGLRDPLLDPSAVPPERFRYSTRTYQDLPWIAALKRLASAVRFCPWLPCFQ